MGAADRLQCVVPGCSRTRGQRKGEPPIREGEEWVCGHHWALVPAFLRRRRSRLKHLYRRAYGGEPYWRFSAGSAPRVAAVRLDRMLRQSWALCKRAAIERAVGLR